MPSILLCHLMSSLVLCCCYADSGKNIWTQQVREVWDGINYNPKIEVLAQSILNRGRPIGPALVPIGGDADFRNASYFYGILSNFGAVLKSPGIFQATAVSELSATRTKLINSQLLTKKDLRTKIVNDKWEIGIITSETDNGIKIVYALVNPDKLVSTQATATETPVYEFVIPLQSDEELSKDDIVLDTTESSISPDVVSTSIIPETPEVTPNENPNISQVNPNSPDVITSTTPDVFKVSPNPNTADVSTTSNSSSSTVDDIGLNPVDEKFTQAVGSYPTTLESSLNPAANDSQSDVPVTSDATNTPSNIQAVFLADSTTSKLESLNEIEDSTNTPDPLKTPSLSSLEQDNSQQNVPLQAAADPDIDTSTAKGDGAAVDSKNTKPGDAPFYKGPLSPRLFIGRPTGLMVGVAAATGKTPVLPKHTESPLPEYNEID